MAHPAQHEVDRHRKNRKHGAGVEDGARTARKRLDRKGGGAVDASSWRPPAARKERDDEGETRMLWSPTYDNMPKYARGGGIHIKSSHEGLLHKDLGVPAGKPIPAAKMEKAKADASPAEKKRIVFAENARHWNHK